MMDGTNEVRVNIYKTDVLIPDADTPQVVSMKGSGKPLTISVTNNDRNKLSVIRSTEAKIEVLTETGIDISTFTGGPDNLWYVEILLNQTDYIFKGFLILADISQSFQPEPQVLVLTASDCLGLLKDIPLVDLDGEVPTGKQKICFYLAYALNKTGMRLPMYVVNNLRHGTGSRTVSYVNFSNPGSTIFFPSETVDMFYDGQKFEVTGGSVSNLNSEFTVTAVNGGGTNIEVSPAPVHESGALNVIFEDISSRGHLYNTVYLDAKTFESEIGECEDCYSVLEKILGYDCFICQYLGSWWIFRVDEWDENQIYVTIFDGAGVYQTDEGATDYNMSIGDAETIEFALADAIVERERPLNFAKLVYRYEYPKEVPCNVDFSRGDVIDDTLPEKTYQLECWTLREGVPGYYGSVDGTTATIHRIFNGVEYETDRYIVLTPRTSFESSSINDATYIESEGIPIREKDKFTTSVDWRTENDITTSLSSNVRLFRCVLNGDDGSWWILGEDTVGDGVHKWFDTALWTINSAKGVVSVVLGDDDTEWKNISWDAPPAPVTGTLYLWMNQLNQLSSANDTIDVWYSNLTFDYYPLINGSYQKYTGQHQKVYRATDGYLNKLDSEVYMSDSPTKLGKGAMFLLIDGAYVLTYVFYPVNVYPSGPPDITPCHPYGELQIRSVWNQGVYANWIFSGNMWPIGEDWPAMIHKYILTDSHPATVNRYFTSVGYEQDWKSGMMNNTLIEVYDRVNLKSYSEPREFKYITNG